MAIFRVCSVWISTFTRWWPTIWGRSRKLRMILFCYPVTSSSTSSVMLRVESRFNIFFRTNESFSVFLMFSIKLNNGRWIIYSRTIVVIITSIDRIENIYLFRNASLIMWYRLRSIGGSRYENSLWLDKRKC